MDNHTEITIRPLRPDDAPAIARHANNINVWNNTRDYLPHPYSPKDAAEFIAHAAAKSPQTDLAIEYGGQTVGVIGYIPGSDVERFSAETGYWVGEEFWGRGIATRAIALLAEHIFATTAITHLFATTFDFNPASMRALEKAGFSRVGVLHGAAVKNGRVTDLHIYEKLKP